MMTGKNKIVIQLFHPLLHKSRINRKMIEAVEDLDGVTVRVLYDLYPDYHIDMKTEQQVLTGHDIIVWQHPFYWYSAPSLLKEWIDIVLEHGFAYGSKGTALAGKKVMTAITTGGRREVYREDGARRYTINQLLVPFEQTVFLCNMSYLPPFVVHGTHLLEGEAIERAARQYRKVILALRDGEADREDLANHQYMNDLIT